MLPGGQRGRRARHGASKLWLWRQRKREKNTYAYSYVTYHYDFLHTAYALAHSCLYHLSPSQAPSTSIPNPPLCKSHSIKMSFLRYKSNGGEFDLFFTWYIQRCFVFLQVAYISFYAVKCQNQNSWQSQFTTLPDSINASIDVM